ncbi:MAG: alpha-L-fucosidase [Capnocytophaga sp.]|nr:alpha-L-fucosidase [Capnocytophaga sp.]
MEYGKMRNKPLQKVVVLLFFMIISCVSVPPPQPSGALPSARQLAWHELEYYAFIHFNMNTFTDMEWGMGNENPEWFNPTELDTEQWAKVAKDAGMKGIIITAKHHDGFCLWPSAYTEHSVKNSPWKDGKGDILKELSESCRKYGLKLGVYLSPWDRHHSEYGREAYVDYFHNQLRELLTQYGTVFEVWFDGANGGSGYYGGANEHRTIDSKTYYQWDKVTQIVRELQPEAVIFGDGGPDVRWIGNESGYGTQTNWASFDNTKVWAGHSVKEHLQRGDENGDKWIPAEADVSIRPGWYYHKREDHLVRSLPEMVDIYYHSVGRNASLLLNLPVDTRGLVHENDIIRLQELKAVIDADFADNLATKATVKADRFRGNNRKYNAQNTIDGNSQTYWTTDDGITNASLEIHFKNSTALNRFMVREYIPLGQRVKAFRLEYDDNDSWKIIDEQTTIGYKRILRFDPVTTTRLRFTILDAKDVPVISEIAVYNAPNLMVAPNYQRNKQGQITLTVPDKTTEIYYTLDGSKPDKNSIRYTKPFAVEKPSMLSSIAYDPVRQIYSHSDTQHIDLSKQLWKVIEVSSGDLSKSETIIDENPQSWWATQRNGKEQFVVIDMGQSAMLSGFSYLPPQDRWAYGTIKEYVFELSIDGKRWTKVAEGEFGNIKNNPVQQTVRFAPHQARYFRFRSTAITDDSNAAAFGEIGIISNDL